ncbi:unnamed protein product [Protopolystoma xenopodis]|uniref:Uncharacterized protein n=1 Tax=Protopolystoma xenopodis TaxID=117903 RepID=A0A448WY65_9PLAT|nr:unnamed protein product [Protopolystoma xenopodis]
MFTVCTLCACLALSLRNRYRLRTSLALATRAGKSATDVKNHGYAV